MRISWTMTFCQVICLPVSDLQVGQRTTVTNVALHKELLQMAVDNYNNNLAKQGLKPTLGRDETGFELVRGQLRLKAHLSIDLLNCRPGRPPSLSTIGSRGGGQAIQDELGFSDWMRHTRLPAQAVVDLSKYYHRVGRGCHRGRQCRAARPGSNSERGLRRCPRTGHYFHYSR